MILPHHRTVLGLDTLHGHTRTHDLRQAINVDRINACALLNIFAHPPRPGLRAENTYAQGSRVRIHALSLHFLDEIAEIRWRSEEHTSELQSLMRISYAVFCLTKKKYKNKK